jgi:transcription elongation factor Elf1
MKLYCPKCGSYSVFVFQNKEKHEEWAVCRNCWGKAAL